MPENPTAPAPVAADPKLVHVAKEWTHERSLFGCRIDPLSRFVFTGAQSNTVQRWDLNTGQKIELAAHDGWVRALACTPDGQTLLSGGYDGHLIWWPLAAEKPTPARVVEAHQGWLRAIALSPDAKQVATCGNDNLVKVWSLADGALLHTLAGHARHVYHVAFRPQPAAADGAAAASNELVSCDLMGVIKQWDLSTGKEARQFEGKALHSYDNVFWADMGGARDLKFRSDGKFFACAGVTAVTNAFAGQGEPLVALYDWEKAEPAQSFKTKEKFTGVAWAVEFHPDGFVMSLFSGGSGGALVFHKPETAEEFHRFKLPSQAFDMSLAADRLTVAVAHNDRRLRLYRLAAKA